LKHFCDLETEKYLKRRQTILRNRLTVRKFETIAEFVAKNSKVLDIGCRDGILANFSPAEFFGIDLSLKALSLAKRWQSVAVADAHFLPFKDESFDACVMSEILEHLMDPQKTMDEVRRVLRNQGELIALVPNDRTFLVARLVMGRLKEATRNRGHLHDLTPRRLRVLLEKCGFMITRIRYLPIRKLPYQLNFFLVCKAQKSSRQI